MNYLMVALGGMFGTLGRYIVTGWVSKYNNSFFPFATLTVNIIGSFMVGFLGALLLEKLAIEPYWRTLILTGFFGAFTTFSTFSFETLKLLQQSMYFYAIANILVSILTGLIAVWLGYTTAKLF